jgi:hypothetical protein
MLAGRCPYSRARSKITAPLVAVALLLGAQGAAAQDSGAKEGMVDPRAESRLQELSDFLGSARTLSFTADSFFDEIEDSGVKIKRFIVHDVVLKRPDRLYFRSTFDDGGTREGWYNGKKLVVAAPGVDSYVEIEAPGSVDALLDFVQENYQLSVPISDLLYSSLFAAQSEHLLSGVYLGQRSLRDTTLDHLSFESVGADWQVWMDAGGPPVPRRIVIAFVGTEGEPEYMASFRDWKFDQAVSLDVFEFEPPANWKRLEPPKSDAE